MRRRRVLAVVRRDLTVLRGNRAVLIPLLVMSGLFVVLLPLSVGLLARLDDPSARTASEAGVHGTELSDLLEGVPAWVFADLPGTPAAELSAVLLGYLIPPVVLIVPLLFALVIATDAIVGERERGTLEGLLLAPLSDRELVVAKLAGALLPALTAGIGGSVIYAVITDVLLWPYLDGPLLPNPTWLLVVLWVGPAMVTAALGLAVGVSARVRTTQGAQQISGLAVLPTVFLAMGQLSGLLFLSPALLIGVGAGLWCLAALFVLAGSRALARDRLSSRLG